MGSWDQLLFASLSPAAPFEEWFRPMLERVGWLPLEQFVYDPSRAKDYLVKGHWALYVDNYLEGFHIPFIHAGLNAVLDYGNYTTELYPYGSLQLGVAADGEEVFDLPSSSPDFGKRIGAYYFWFFPNLMFNFYPWGLSINVIKPLAPDLTRVSFLQYVWDPTKLRAGAGAALDRVEREDEHVVELVQKGVRSRLYDRGRYSPTRETGTHHFHRMLVRFLSAQESLHMAELR
jgi:choline monooxygenase